ncbi:hypothetical protein L208DRAFT_1377619 [Tricholoma matsutake]|nr:hypothetical protein L208DRAFT_1377619 [Tricholoma matsutake 945]
MLLMLHSVRRHLSLRSAGYNTLNHQEDILEGSDYGDDQLAHWDQAPPYAVQGDIEIIGKLEDVQHGWQHQIQHEYEESRLKDYKTKPADIILSEVYHKILKSLCKWEEANCALVGLQNPFDIRMGEHWKKWQARQVVSLRQDWEALQEGSDKFLCMYFEYTTYWQFETGTTRMLRPVFIQTFH